jgi:hypothetical protein
MENVKELSTKELKQWIDDGKDFVLLDVLAAASYEARQIQRLRWLPTAQVPSVAPRRGQRVCWPRRAMPMSIIIKTDWLAGRMPVIHLKEQLHSREPFVLS